MILAWLDLFNIQTKEDGRLDQVKEAAMTESRRGWWRDMDRTGEFIYLGVAGGGDKRRERRDFPMPGCSTGRRQIVDQFSSPR